MSFVRLVYRAGPKVTCRKRGNRLRPRAASSSVRPTREVGALLTALVKMCLVFRDDAPVKFGGHERGSLAAALVSCRRRSTKLVRTRSSCCGPERAAPFKSDASTSRVCFARSPLYTRLVRNMSFQLHPRLGLLARRGLSACWRWRQ